MSSLKPPTSQPIDVTGPTRLGYYSCRYDPESESYKCYSDKSGLRYLSYPNVNAPEIDLLKGYSEIKKWRRVHLGGSIVLRWLLENSNVNADSELSFNFILPSIVLRSLLVGPFTNDTNWLVVAVKVGGSIYIDGFDSEKRALDIASQNELVNAGIYAGMRFIDEYSCSFDGNRDPNWTNGNRDSFYLINKIQINNHSLIYSNLIDCAIDKDQYDRPLNEMEFAKFITRSPSWNVGGGVHYWNSRVVRVWTESLVSGVDKIICGQKKQRNMIEKVIEMNAKDLLPWSPDICFKYFDQLLTFIKTVVTEELVPYRFEHRPDGLPSWTKLDEPVDEYIPPWFIDRQLPVD